MYKLSIAACLVYITCTTQPLKQLHHDSEALFAVKGLCTAREKFDALQMEAFLSDSFSLVSTDKKKRLYNRQLAPRICAWEKQMNTHWSHEILGVDSNVVTVLAKETSDYFTLLGLGAGIQVNQYEVRNKKIEKSTAILFITATSTQDKEYSRFYSWLLSQPGIHVPDLIAADGSLKFDGSSAQRMIYWLKQWNTGASR